MSRSLKILKYTDYDKEWKKFVFSQEQLKQELEMKEEFETECLHEGQGRSQMWGKANKVRLMWNVMKIMNKSCKQCKEIDAMFDKRQEAQN